MSEVVRQREAAKNRIPEEVLNYLDIVYEEAKANLLAESKIVGVSNTAYGVYTKQTHKLGHFVK
jgi:hypothetical protein